MATKLIRFKVQNFRSIEESDWIEFSDNSCLVGTNEAGKTNLLMALWKLNPANKEPIVPLDDFPRHNYSNYKADNHSEDVFVIADFNLDQELQILFAKELNCDIEQVKTTLVQRKYSGNYYISFPYTKIDNFPKERIQYILDNFKNSLEKAPSYVNESDPIKSIIISLIKESGNLLTKDLIDKEIIDNIITKITNVIENKLGRKQNLPSFIKNNLLGKFEFFRNAFEGKSIQADEEIKKRILKSIPKFVYYSDYGNLDSEIFLPRVIEDFKRTDLTESARAKARTLDVLFKYVKLSPEEIYELGNDSKVIIHKYNQNNQLLGKEEVKLSEEEIREWADKKRERGILLRSAATQLTQNFKKWWLQGDYIFSFEADGNHFRINVADDLRPEPIELESRSRGLQWFFSFFLVFLVETKAGHSNTILLLDEPGLSLHPIAQYDLAKFFRKLSDDNQLMYTSHSPFLVDMDNLANVKVVYIDSETGRTKISSNLRYNVSDSVKSIYPIHAALGLTVSDTLLLGCLPVLVEGVSDQIYLSLIKRYLIGNGVLQYSKEIVFIPTGGVKGMGPVSKLVSSRDDELPFVFLDSDEMGKNFQKNLKNNRYKNDLNKVLEVDQFLEDKGCEIEDLLPSKAIISNIDRKYRCDQYLEDVFQEGIPIVDQIERWAKANSINLEDGWKVEMARSIQNNFDRFFNDNLDKKYISSWSKIFKNFT